MVQSILKQIIESVTIPITASQFYQQITTQLLTASQFYLQLTDQLVTAEQFYIQLTA
jgi:hypothetical protein